MTIFHVAFLVLGIFSLTLKANGCVSDIHLDVSSFSTQIFFFSIGAVTVKQRLLNAPLTSGWGWGAGECVRGHQSNTPAHTHNATLSPRRVRWHSKATALTFQLRSNYIHVPASAAATKQPVVLYELTAGSLSRPPVTWEFGCHPPQTVPAAC